MAINIDHSPISSGLAAAQRAGEGDQFNRKFAQERQLVSQGLQARQIDDQRVNQEIQRSMQQQQLAQRATQQQRQFALAQTAAGQGERKLSLSERQQSSKESYQSARLNQQQQQVDINRKNAERQQTKTPNPLDDPRYEALAKIASPLERKFEKFQEQLARAAGDITGRPAEVERRMGDWLQKPISVGGGKTVTPQQILDAKNQYLGAIAPLHEAASFAEEVAEDKRELENKIDEVVGKLSKTLPPNSGVDVIKSSVVQELGRPTSIEDLEVIVEAVNEIEHELQQKQLGRRAANVAQRGS